MTIYFIRHGETEHNSGAIQQSAEIALSDRGREQITALTQRLTSEGVECILSSSFLRAQQSAEQIAGAFGHEVTITDLLREVKRPSELEGKSMFDPGVVSLKKMLQQNYGDPQWHYSDEENYFDFSRRAVEATRYISSQNAEKVAVVTHENFLKVMLSVLLFGEDVSPENYLAIYYGATVNNAGLTIAEFSNGKWLLRTFNECGFLEKQKAPLERE